MRVKIKKLSQVNWFLGVVNECNGDVWLTSSYGDKYNLKSALSQYLSVAALLSEKGDELELWCQNQEDEARFYKLFNEHPEILA